MPMNLAALTIGGAFSSISLLGIAQAATPDPTNLGPYVGGGAGVIAVGVLAEVTRRLLNGTLIPRVTRESEAELGAAIVAAGQREAAYLRLAEESQTAVRRAEDTLKATAEGLRVHNERLAADLAEKTERQNALVTDQIAALTRAANDLRDELRELRRGGPR